MSTIMLPASPAKMGVLVLGLLALGAELAAKAGASVAERAHEARVRVREAIARRGGR